MDAAAINEGATKVGCAAKLTSLGFALLHEVSRVRCQSTKTRRSQNSDTGFDNVTPIAVEGAVNPMAVPIPIVRSGGRERSLVVSEPPLDPTGRVS